MSISNIYNNISLEDIYTICNQACERYIKSTKIIYNKECNEINDICASFREGFFEGFFYIYKNLSPSFKSNSTISSSFKNLNDSKDELPNSNKLIISDTFKKLGVFSPIGES